MRITKGKLFSKMVTELDMKYLGILYIQWLCDQNSNLASGLVIYCKLCYSNGSLTFKLLVPNKSVFQTLAVIFGGQFFFSAMKPFQITQHLWANHWVAIIVDYMHVCI